MSDNAEPSRIETRLYDADGNRTDEREHRGPRRVVGLDAEGRVIARHAHTRNWEVDPISLEGDPGELATRPEHEPS